jgi:hypothetical protein
LVRTWAKLTDSSALVTFRTGRSESEGSRSWQSEGGHQPRCGDVAGGIVYLFQVQLNRFGEVRSASSIV